VNLGPRATPAIHSRGSDLGQTLQVSAATSVLGSGPAIESVFSEPAHFFDSSSCVVNRGRRTTRCAGAHGTGFRSPAPKTESDCINLCVDGGLRYAAYLWFCRPDWSGPMRAVWVLVKPTNENDLCLAVFVSRRKQDYATLCRCERSLRRNVGLRRLCPPSVEFRAERTRSNVTRLRNTRAFSVFAGVSAKFLT